MQQTNLKSETGNAIPVYAFTQHGADQQAAHPDHKETLKPITREITMPRVGSAWLEPDGSYIISLVSMPVNGQLYMNPADPSLTSSKTYKEDKV